MPRSRGEDTKGFHAVTSEQHDTWCWWFKTDGYPGYPHELGVPMWLPAVVLALPALAVWTLDTIATRRRNRKGLCPKCGYSRRGIGPDAPCPECGTATSPK